MKFADFINEKSAQNNTEMKYLISKNAIPISSSMMDRLGYSYEEEAYHMTSAHYLDGLKNIQHSKKQISAFTQGSNELMKLPSNPNVLVKLEGTIVIDAASDMWTSIDKQGRRWINLEPKSKKNGTEFSEKLAFNIDGIQSKIKKSLGYDVKTKIEDMNKSDRNKMYKTYIDEVEDYLQNGGYKLLSKHLNSNITYGYNEVILNSFTIIGAYSLENDTQKSEIENTGIPYLGVFPLSNLNKIGN